jgi:Zn-dependent alcohol dehydrogenase
VTTGIGAAINTAKVEPGSNDCFWRSAIGLECHSMQNLSAQIKLGFPGLDTNPEANDRSREKYPA